MSHCVWMLNDVVSHFGLKRLLNQWFQARCLCSPVDIKLFCCWAVVQKNTFEVFWQNKVVHVAGCRFSSEEACIRKKHKPQMHALLLSIKASAKCLNAKQMSQTNSLVPVFFTTVYTLSPTTVTVYQLWQTSHKINFKAALRLNEKWQPVTYKRTFVIDLLRERWKAL